MWNILDRVVGRVRFGYFDRASMFASTKKRMAAGIGNLGAVDNKHVVMETWNEWCCNYCPDTVSLFLHFYFGSTPKVHADLCGVRRFHTQLNSTTAINARVFCPPHVCTSGLEITWLLGTTHSRQQEQ